MDQGSDWQVPGYESVQELGRGGFGRVVLARRVADGAPVAVKYLAAKLVGDERFREEFRHEARMLVGLQSAYTVRLYDYVESGDVPGAAIVMEYVPGASLRKLLAGAEGAPMPAEAALGILKGSLLGLAAAHGIGVVHRDYKPENVLVRPEGTSILADFGIAVRAGDASAEIVGTPPYMAPEQFAGAPPSASADVYAATAVFFECVTGNRPVDLVSSGLDSWADAHRAVRVPVELAPEPVRELVARGLAKDPAIRPAQAQAFAEELERIAVAGYGADWERRGRDVLVGALAGLAATGVALSLISALGGPALPVPVPVPAPTIGPVPGAVPPPTIGPVPGAVPPPTMGPVPSPVPAPTLGSVAAKSGVAKAVAIATAAVTATAGITTAVVLATSADPKPRPPVPPQTPTLTATTPAASSQPTTPAAPSTTQLVLGRLAGDWVSHAAGLTIAPDGSFTVSTRVYGDQPNAWATATGHLTTATGTTGAGVVTTSDSSGPQSLPLGDVTVTYSQDTDTVDFNQGTVDRTFCGPKAPAGYCGA